MKLARENLLIASIALAGASACSSHGGGGNNNNGAAPCGATASSTGGGYGIFDGQLATAAVAPYTGSLFASTSDVEVMCTGSLICPNVVLTAAHCFNDGSNPPVAAKSYRFSLAGSVPFTGAASDVLSAPPDAAYGTDVQINPGWTGSAQVSSGPDMAILRLAKSFSGALAPLTFTAIPDPTSGQGLPATAVGYGESSQDGSGAGTKRVGSVFYQGAVPAESGQPADPGTLLTLRGAQGQDTCDGDSGGPLIINNGVYGTLSAGDAATCGAPIGGTVQGLSYYSSVPNNKAWIQSVMQQWCGTTVPTASSVPTGTGAATPSPEPCKAG